MLKLLIATTLLFAPTAFAKSKHEKGHKKSHHVKAHKKSQHKKAAKKAAPSSTVAAPVETVDPVPVPIDEPGQ